MKSVTFDFSTIHSMPDFYQQFADTFLLPDWFGRNLDALWDVLTAVIPLPAEIVFTHFDPQSIEFEPLLSIFAEAQEECGGLLVFRCCDGEML
ncbi:MAG: barstar family protein [Enterobacteriaceae bacterium]|jgi:ribonuclease inhibitor|nr:barstar family protein [Enterobacteriaceae bacterium]